MCTTCGCGHDQARIEGPAGLPSRSRVGVGLAPARSGSRIGDGAAAYLARRRRAAADAPPHEAAHAHFHDLADAKLHEPSTSRTLRVEQDILARNDAFAAINRRRLAELGVFAVNLVSSPGSGKTTLLVRSIASLSQRVPVTVIEGDQQTSNDAERIRATGAPAIQINTGKGCHLDARMVGRALDRLPPPPGSLLMIENVGNLVCPAGFDLGEAHKVVILSVTEGEDKPLKYPDMFRAADLMLLAKVDLLPYLAFDVDLCIEHARRVNPGIEVLAVSSVSGDGLAPWIAWLLRGVARARLPVASAATATSPAAAAPDA